jgi:intracellular sulfur oxidation DsrE/DsrF family protein
MKYLHIVFLLLMISFSSNAQSKKHRVVWDLSSADTTVQAAVFRQINNARVEIPDLDIEVVFHGQAIYVMMKDSTQFADRIKIAKDKGVTLAVCNNSLRRLKIDPSQVSPSAIVVPSAVAELIKKQTDGWSYLKASH